MKDLPSNIQAEAALIGICLVNSQKALEIITSLDANDFVDPNARTIFEAFKELYERNDKISSSAVIEVLTNSGNLERVGGYEGVLKYAEQFAYEENVEQNIRLIKDKSLLRDLMILCQQIVEGADAPDQPIGEYLAQSEEQVLAITRRRKVGNFTAIGEIAAIIKERIKDPQTSAGIKSGFRYLDNLLHGFQPSDMIILAARPSTGKTALALNFAVNAALKNKKVAIFSLEMAAIKLVERIIASLAKVSGEKLRDYKYLNEHEINRVQQSLDKIAQMNIYIDDTSSLTLSEIQAKARKLKDVDIIFVDYIGLIDSKKKVETRQLEVAEYSRGLKALARELKIPIIVLSQLSRESEKRKGTNEPMLSDLRDSGAIEQDADVVLMLTKIKEKDSANQGTIIVNVLKHRNGATGKVPLTFHRDRQLFESVESTEE